MTIFLQVDQPFRTGQTSRCKNSTLRSSQKSQMGRRKAENSMKNTTLPPAAPSRMNPRNCPSACRSTNRDSAPPAVRQYSRSSTPVKLGNRRRTVRSRSYTTPAARPSKMARPKERS